MTLRALTAIELGVVVCILVVVAAVFFVVRDPASAVAKERNVQRWTDVSALLEGVHTALTQSHGQSVASLRLVDADPYTVQMIVSNATETVCATSCGEYQLSKVPCTVDFSALVNEGFIAAIPRDPLADQNGTGYVINEQDGVFTVAACTTEQEKDGTRPTIQLSRPLTVPD